MKDFELQDEDITCGEIKNKIQDIFGSYEKTGDSKYIVSSPDSPVLESISVDVYESHIGLDIEEKSVKTVIANNNLDKVEDAVRKKNFFLRAVTGNTVQDRKEKMREEVTDVPVARENTALEKY